MGTDKRERQKAGRQARIEAAEQAAKKAEGRRRLTVAAAIIGFVVLIALVFTLVTKDKKKNDTASTTSTTSAVSTTTLAPMPSAAGKDCVALADPLPAGAPNVPITPGPPPTQLVVQDIKEGTGDAVTADQTVTVNYIGVSCSTGKIFDDSYTRGQPATFPLSQVIPGWTQGIPGMKPGGERLLIIPSSLAYGAQGSPPKIAPDETLYFVVDMVSAAAPTASSSTTAATPTN